MKKLFTLFVIVLFVSKVNAQMLLSENFDFTGKLVDNGWRITGTSVVDEISTTSGLTYTSYVGSGVGNAANLIGTGQDVHRDFDSVKTDGASVYASFLVRVTEATTQTGTYFFHLGNKAAGSTTFANFCARLYAKTDATTGNVNFAILNSNVTPTYGSTNYALNTTYLIIIKYTISVAGNDNVKMWIKTTGVPQTEAAAGTPDFDVTDAGQNSISAVGFRQATGLPDVVLDGLRIGQTWEQSVLPLNLTSFSASLVNKEASLVWNTTNEINVDGFAIEKSNDARNFKQIGFVAAKNTTTASYSFNDVLEAGVSYYRLKMTDKDGSFKYSSIVVLNSKPSTKLEVFPNPVKNTATLTHELAGTKATIKVVSIEGKNVVSQNIQTGATQSTIDVSKLVRGNYVIVFENEGTRTSVQFVKQ